MNNLAAEFLILIFKFIATIVGPIFILFLIMSYFYIESPNAFHSNTSIIKTTSEPKKPGNLKLTVKKLTQFGFIHLKNKYHEYHNYRWINKNSR